MGVNNKVFIEPSKVFNGSGYKTPKNKMSNNKTPKISKCPMIQNVQNYKISKVTKCKEFQNVIYYIYLLIQETFRQ